MEILPNNPARKKLLILASVLLFFLVILLIILNRQKNRLLNEEILPGGGQFNQEESRIDSKLQTPAQPLTKVPSMTFDTYPVVAETVVLPQKVKSYTFNKEFSLPFVSIVGQKLGLKESRQEDNTVILYNGTESAASGYLKFNLKNGVYEFSNFSSRALPQGSSVNARVRNYLLDLGLIDETVACGITYQRTSMPQMTFVECHRDWQNAGLPIINLVGLLNMPELKSVKEVQVGLVDDNAPDDLDIVNVSTGQNGKARPADFNTVTVAVDSQGNLVRITSNLKMIEASVDFEETDLITPSEAQAAFKTGQSTLSLVVPSDSSLAWDTVFPNNTAYNLQSQDVEMMLTYIENPFGSKSLTPMYLARGTAKTADGYSVKFLQAMPAVRNQQTLSGEVAGLMAQAVSPYPTLDESLKLGTFNPDQGGVKQQVASSCVPAEYQLSPILDMGEYGKIGQFTIDAQNQKRANNWFLIPAPAASLPDINEVVAAFDSLMLEGKSANLRDLKELQDEWVSFNFCPLRLTGSSPSLFLYGAQGQSYEVKVERLLTYAYPQANTDGWQVSIAAGDLMVAGQLVDSLYYEYLPVDFQRPASGWLVTKNTLAGLADKIGRQLKLTEEETAKLSFELNLAAKRVSGDRLFVGPLTQTQVDNKVPLTVRPNIPLFRYHFYVGQAKGQVASPKFSPLERTAQMAVEIGAYSPSF